MMPSRTPWSRPKAKPAMNSSPPPPARPATLLLTAMRVSSVTPSPPAEVAQEAEHTGLDDGEQWAEGEQQVRESPR